MNICCCEDVGVYKAHEAIYYSRRSSYKFNNYTSQSTNSQSQFQLQPMRGQVNSMLHQRQQIPVFIAPAANIETKYTSVYSAYCNF